MKLIVRPDSSSIHKEAIPISGINEENSCSYQGRNNIGNLSSSNRPRSVNASYHFMALKEPGQANSMPSSNPETRWFQLFGLLSQKLVQQLPGAGWRSWGCWNLAWVCKSLANRGLAQCFFKKIGKRTGVCLNYPEVPIFVIFDSPL